MQGIGPDSRGAGLPDDDYNPLDTLGNGGQTRIADIALDPIGTGVDSHNPVAPLPQLTVDQIAGLVMIPGNPDHGDTLQGQESGDCLLEIGHRLGLLNRGDSYLTP